MYFVFVVVYVYFCIFKIEGKILEDLVCFFVYGWLRLMSRDMGLRIGSFFGERRCIIGGGFGGLFVFEFVVKFCEWMMFKDWVLRCLFCWMRLGEKVMFFGLF